MSFAFVFMDNQDRLLSILDQYPGIPNPIGKLDESFVKHTGTGKAWSNTETLSNLSELELFFQEWRPILVFGQTSFVYIFGKSKRLEDKIAMKVVYKLK